jgi:hypothetical protein
MNIGSKKLQREVGSTFCGAQGKNPELQVIGEECGGVSEIA